MTEIPDEALEKIRADLARHRPGLWAEEGIASGRIDLGPQCLCGAGERTLAAARALKSTYGKPTGECQRHPAATRPQPPRPHTTSPPTATSSQEPT